MAGEKKGSSSFFEKKEPKKLLSLRRQRARLGFSNRARQGPQ
jgi:hypothetical protein